MPGATRVDVVEPVRMIDAFSFSSGKAFCTVNSTPLTFVPKVASNWSSVISPSGAETPPPELATTTSSPRPRSAIAR